MPRVIAIVEWPSRSCDHVPFDDPEWAADAAHGALTNEYGIETVYTELQLVSEQ
jgi:hypothetical protein